jgi:hypothetical protein
VEGQRPVFSSRYPVSLFVHGAMVVATQKHEVRKRGVSSLRPVLDMVRLNESQAAAGKAADLVSM